MSARTSIISQTTRKIVKKPAAAKPARRPVNEADGSGTVTLRDLLREVAALRTAVEKAAPAPARADLAQDSEVAAIRRALGDLMERRMESFLKRLAAVRGLAASRGGAAAPALLAAIDPLIGEMGGLRFEVARLDFFDPLIHRVIGERHDASHPEGVVLEMGSAGWRTAGGVVLEKAAVVVNRRD
jgi:hypothetical protein